MQSPDIAIIPPSTSGSSGSARKRNKLQKRRPGTRRRRSRFLIYVFPIVIKRRRIMVDVGTQTDPIPVEASPKRRSFLFGLGLRNA